MNLHFIEFLDSFEENKKKELVSTRINLFHVSLLCSRETRKYKYRCAIVSEKIRRQIVGSLHYPTFSPRIFPLISRSPKILLSLSLARTIRLWKLGLKCFIRVQNCYNLLLITLSMILREQLKNTATIFSEFVRLKFFVILTYCIHLMCVIYTYCVISTSFIDSYNYNFTF